MRQLLRVGTAAGVLGALFAACSSAPTTETSGKGGHSASSGAGAGHGSSGFGAGDLGSGFTFTTGVIGGSGAGAGGGETCAGETSKAELVQLDIYLMLDSSGSMNETVAGVTKWASVTQALSTFFNDPHSAGLGLGLQHFPTRGAGVPSSCTSNQDCPAGSGPCLFKVCSNQPSLTPCTSGNDCPFGSQCLSLGKCGTEYCAPANGALCSGTFLACSPISTSVCAHENSCTPADYAAPLVDISPLNTAAPQLDGAIAALVPQGTTPTAPALEGAIRHAKEWAAQNPTHAVVVVLATDGLPTACMPLDIPSIAQIAAQGVAVEPSVKTFAIGVFAPSDINAGAKQNLDDIAAAGGTNDAFIIDTSQGVEQQFLAALDAIRGTKLACEFTIPPAGGAGALDFGKVNVEHTAPGGSASVTIGYVGAAAGCDATNGGWYYDVDPATGGVPTKIIMCPATCAGFGAVSGGQVEIRVGCKTVFGPPPK